MNTFVRIFDRPLPAIPSYANLFRENFDTLVIDKQSPKHVSSTSACEGCRESQSQTPCISCRHKNKERINSPTRGPVKELRPPDVPRIKTAVIPKAQSSSQISLSSVIWHSTHSVNSTIDDSGPDAKDAEVDGSVVGVTSEPFMRTVQSRGIMANVSLDPDNGCRQSQDEDSLVSRLDKETSKSAREHPQNCTRVSSFWPHGPPSKNTTDHHTIHPTTQPDVLDTYPTLLVIPGAYPITPPVLPRALSPPRLRSRNRDKQQKNHGHIVYDSALSSDETPPCSEFEDGKGAADPRIDTGIPHVGGVSTDTGDLIPSNLFIKIDSVDNIAIATGGFASVHIGSLNGSKVAVKAVRMSQQNERVARRRLNREIVVWKGLNHLNITPLLGVAKCPTLSHFVVIITPWYDNGSAEAYLSSRAVDFSERLELSLGVARGVRYLHNLRPVVIHGDLKPSNVLIDQRGVPMLCDFGLARIINEEVRTGLTTTTKHSATLLYAAPEILSASEDAPFEPSTASDIYSLGSLLYQFLTGKRPYEKLSSCTQILRAVDKGAKPATRPTGIASFANLQWDLFESCWRESHKRPSTSHVVVSLVWLRTQYDPISRP